MPDRPDWTDAELQTFQQQVVLSSALTINAVEGGASGTLVAATASRRIVLAGLAARASGTVDTRLSLRDWVTILVRDATTTTLLGFAALAPDSPFAWAQLPPGGAAAGVGNAIEAIAYPRYGSGKQQVAVFAYYYLIA